MKKIIFLTLIAALGSAGNALAKPTDGILFSCSQKLKHADGSEKTLLSVFGTIPFGKFDRLGFAYKTESGRFAVLNEAENSFIKSTYNDLDQRYGQTRRAIEIPAAEINVNLASRFLSVMIPLVVQIDGKDQSREIYFSSVPGSMLLTRNDENGRTGSFKAIFTGIDPINLTSQLADKIVDCSFNINFE